jgi:hypothetical protein
MRNPLRHLSRRVLRLASAAPGAMPQSSTTPVPEKRFYERVYDLRQRDPDLVRIVRSQQGLPPEMNSLQWLLGTWKSSGQVFPTPSTPERVHPEAGVSTHKTVPESTWIWKLDTQEGTGIFMPWISYDRPSKRYVMNSCVDAGVYGVLTSPGMQGNRITFEGDVTIFNISIHLRQTFTKASTNEAECEIFNEERMSDGTWTPIDQYHMTRQS